MLRRSHKKSRRGCLECKRRHVKCDEKRPVCSLCAVSQLSCRYTSNAVLAGSSTHVAFQQARGSSDCDASPLGSFNAIQHFPISESPDIRNSSYPGLDEAVNLNHMELLVHMASNKELFTLGYHNGDRTTSVISGLRISLDAPYVLYQLLAFAARHLAYLRPEQADIYLYQATALQTRAISLFNASWNGISQTNCVAMVLFSSVLGSHILVDTLARRVEGGLVPFIEHFVQCINVEKGVYTIASMAWPLLMKSELETILSRSSQFTSQTPRGNHCRGINELLDDAKELDESQIQACREAANYLQVGFDAVFSKSKDEDEDEDEEKQDDVENSSDRFHMISSWLMLVKPAFRDLLSNRRPEALVVLAYYALLLHHAKHMWQIGDSGAYILKIIDEYFAPEWKCWLKYPRDEITKSSHVSND